MSIINAEIKNSDVIPAVESTLFTEHPDSVYAVGMLAVGDVALAGLENEYTGYYDLRKRVYVHQTGQLDPSEIKEDGTDRDEDDKRSVAFGVIENRGYDQRLVGSLRLILKNSSLAGNDARPLPVEEFCPEVFAEKPAPADSVEVSRFISRHEKAASQEVIRWLIYGTALAYIDNHKLGPTYGVIEPWLERHLKGSVPVSRIGEPRYIEHYRDSNLPIEVHTDKFIDKMRETYPDLIKNAQDNENGMQYIGTSKRLQWPYIDRRRHDTPVDDDRRVKPLAAAV